MTRIISFAQAVNEAVTQAMTIDANVFCYGLGVDDPKGVFGTTLGLKERFGEERVFDTPTSENAMTGIGIGASLNGLRPVMVHQRLDFFLLAMDQLVNNAAKWHYMFGGKQNVPITIRLIIGRGWGQGPTHSQNLQSWFAHIPGLKVVMPTTAYDAKGLLLESIFDDNPVVFLEHRWLHEQRGDVPENPYQIPIGQANLMKEGGDITIVAMSYMTVEALQAWKILEENNIYCDLIDLRSVRPIDWNCIYKSVEKTGRLLVLDTANPVCSLSSEIVARVTMDKWSFLKHAPIRLTVPDCPTPTSFGLTKDFYITSEKIIETILNTLNRNLNSAILKKEGLHDVPGEWFRGPF